MKKDAGNLSTVGFPHVLKVYLITPTQPKNHTYLFYVTRYLPSYVETQLNPFVPETAQY